SAHFKDYAAIALCQNRVAVVSQESKRLWIGEINDTFDGFNQTVGDVYRFPTDNYCNVEGVSWVSDDQLVMVSDRCKKNQKKRCREKDQSIHLFRIPKLH
ncbi:MAG: LpqB family beta-propeller domain-containing protein, partial [Rubripirellula sp.]|nr:LpqB family beta-propeller domain-containing protein [Rubripirellula sp.]